MARAIAEVCLDQGWSLENVETADVLVSVVVESFAEPGKVVHHFKVAASRALALLDGKGPERRRFNRRADIVRLMDTDLPPRHWLEANRHSAAGSSRRG